MSQAAYEFEPEQEGSSTEGVKEHAQEVVSQVQDSAETAKEKVGDRLTRLVDERSTQGGEQAIGMADSIRQSVQSLREQGQDGPARMAEQAADRVQALGMYLRDNDGNRILSDVEDFARRQPLIVAAGAFAIGLAGARFLKASSARRQESDPTFGSTSMEQYAPPPPPMDTGLGLGDSSGIGTAGAMDTEMPPLDPDLDGVTDFGAPVDGATMPDTAPPTTATP